MFKKICFSTMFILATNALSDINVTTTIYPLYSIAKEVGGDKIKLNNIIPFASHVDVGNIPSALLHSWLVYVALFGYEKVFAALSSPPSINPIFVSLEVKGVKSKFAPLSLFIKSKIFANGMNGCIVISFWFDKYGSSVVTAGCTTPLIVSTSLWTVAEI